MSDQKDQGGVLWDAPNQQVVRDDASPPWQEGTGGAEGPVADQETDETRPAPARRRSAAKPGE